MEASTEASITTALAEADHYNAELVARILSPPSDEDIARWFEAVADDMDPNCVSSP